MKSHLSQCSTTITEVVRAMNQSQFLAIICNSLKAREKSRVHGAIGFGFASYWLKKWRDSLKPITKPSNRNHVITFDSHLKTALLLIGFPFVVVLVLVLAETQQVSCKTEHWLLLIVNCVEIYQYHCAQEH